MLGKIIAAATAVVLGLALLICAMTAGFLATLTPTTPTPQAAAPPAASTGPAPSSGSNTTPAARAGAGSGAGAGPRGAGSVGDIPPGYLALYRAAAARCPGLDWSTLAAIGKIESDHGRSRLPGVAPGSVNSAGAAGPMQFLQATFTAYATNLPPGGAHPPSRWNPHDAIHAASNYLCASGARDNRDLSAALFAYNHSRGYVTQVLTQAAHYRAQATPTTPNRARPTHRRTRRPIDPRRRRGDRVRPQPTRQALPLGRQRRRRRRFRLLRTHPRRLRRRRNHHPPYRPDPVPNRPTAPTPHTTTGRGPRLLQLHPRPDHPRRARHLPHPHDQRTPTRNGHPNRPHRPLPRRHPTHRPRTPTTMTTHATPPAAQHAGGWAATVHAESMMRRPNRPYL